MSVFKLNVIPRKKCIIRFPGVPPFYSDKYDLKEHPGFRMAGVLAAGSADGLKPIFNIVVMGGAGILAFKGLATLGESQGEQSSAQKSQAYGFLGGAAILAVGGLALIDYLFNSLSV